MNAINTTPIVADTGLRWTAFRVMSQREKACVAALERRGFHMWYPIEKKKVRVCRHAKRKVVREFPLIPGYLFMGTEGEPPLYELAKLRHIILGVVSFGGQPAQIDPRGMAALIKISGQEPPDETQITFSAGDRVRFAPGSAFSGLQAKIESVRNARAIIDMLGNGRSIDVPLASLELVA